MSGEKAFEFVKIDELPSKPRKTGIIEIRGPYYSSITADYLQGLFSDWGEYFDGYKFAGGSQRLLTKEKVRKIIGSCHEHDVYVSTGGFVERVIVQGSGAVDQYLEECKSLGFDVVEVSSGLAPIELDDKIEIVRQVQEIGMKAKPEISMMVGAGAGTHRVGYVEDMKMRTLEEVLDEADKHFRAGAYMIMFESEGITEDLPPERWRTDVVRKIADKFGFERFMFEASDPPVFKWYLTEFGKSVNLFIDYSQIVEFQAWRSGLWGDENIWKGKKLSYRRKSG